MKNLILAVVVCGILIGCREREVIICRDVQQPVVYPPAPERIVTRTVVEERPVVYQAVPETRYVSHGFAKTEETKTIETKYVSHSIIGDTIKASVLILTDVVGIVFPVEYEKKEILRTRLYEGW